ncbi:hypothetical protein, partial [Pseudomonas sp. MPR-R2A4]|uniref:hypothetical protein n=1 Tax=Pseudomonas sp. MPR-R2A4 TaxID=2070620 RepID=UPI001C47F823
IEVGDFRGGVEVWRKAGGHQLNTNTPETTKPLHFCRGFVLYGAAPDERYLSAGLGFLWVWKSVENLAYPKR